MAPSILPAEGVTLEVVAKLFRETLLQPLLVGGALLASSYYPSRLQKLLFTATKGKISPSLLIQALKILMVAGTAYRSNRLFNRLVLNNFVSDKFWDCEREIVLVTGGCSGIGRLMVQKLSESKVTTVVFDISEPRSPFPSNVFFYKVDIASPEAIREAAQRIRIDVGHPTVLINNAGVGWNTEILKQTEKQIRTTFSVNILAHFFMVREFAPFMIQQNHGHIVAVASMASFVVHASNVDYACTKAATLAFHEGLAQELKARYGARKVRTTVVHLTWVRTPMIESLARPNNFNEFVLEPISVAEAVIDQIFKGESAQLILPVRLGIMSSVRGWPSWLQEGLRNSIANLLRSISGINAAYRVQEGLPDHSYAILEDRSMLGGTWSLFKYPGIRSDSDLFTFGFPWDPWNEDMAIATAPAILSYLQTVCKRHRIDRHIKYNHKVISLNWGSKIQQWRVQVLVNGTDSQEYFARSVAMGTGYYDYHKGLEVEIPGLSNFQGQVIHPQFWPEDLDYANEKIVIIGSGATAVTILPAMCEKASHITMLQRSPGYFVSLPQSEPINKLIKRWLPPRWAPWVLRLRYLLNFHTFYYWCQLFPTKARQALRSEVAKALPPGVSVDPHFTPSYLPWEQRMCIVPDGDFFQALRGGKASVVTDQIETITPSGIRLKSGQVLDADIIITATGLKMQFLGNASLQIDGQPVRIGDKFLWRGVMLQDVPNLALLLGYTNASWTLGSDVSSQLFVRVLQDVERRGMTTFVPKLNDEDGIQVRPMMNLKLNYIKSAMENNVIPKCGDSAAWRPRRSFFLDLWFVRYGNISTGMVFGRG